MTNTLAEVEAFAASHPHPHQGGTWNQRCEQFINNAGGFSQAYATALLAGNASGPLDPNHATAQPGEIHYWSGAGDGHDAFQTERGLLCASNAISGYLGYISFADFARAKPAFKYRGHTFRHGTQTLAAGTSTASTGTTTPVPTGRTDHTMLFYKVGTSPLLYALAGTSPGTPANWLETTDSGFATQLSAQLGGPSAGLSAASYESWKTLYLEPLAIAGTPTGQPAQEPKAFTFSGTVTAD